MSQELKDMEKDDWRNGYEALRGAPRMLMHVDLAPAQGDRFQPTGFADLGAAVYVAALLHLSLFVQGAWLS